MEAGIVIDLAKFHTSNQDPQESRGVQWVFGTGDFFELMHSQPELYTFEGSLIYQVLLSLLHGEQTSSNFCIGTR